MELYTIRYNLHNYINKDNFDYTSTKEYIFLWKYTLIALFGFLAIIFIYKFRQIQTIGFIIIFIISLFIYIIYFEIGVLINNIEQNRYLKEYGNYYELVNIIFNESFDFIDNYDELDENNKISNINQLLENIYLKSNNLDKIDNNYLIININKEIINTNDFKSFIGNYISIIKLEELNGDIINIIFDNIIYNSDNSNINDIFNNKSKIYLFLINKQNKDYYIHNNYLYINIDRNKNSIEYNYFEELIKYNQPSNFIYDDSIITYEFNEFNKNNNENIKQQLDIINSNNKKIYIKINYEYLKTKKDYFEKNNFYVYYFLQKVVIQINNDNSVYNNLFDKIKNINKIVNLKINIEEIKDNDKLDKNLYIKGHINKLINKINYSNKKVNNFIVYAQNKNILLSFFEEYQRIKGKIIYNMKYEDNKTNDEINETYYNQIKKNNDLLKYIDVFKLDYVKKYLFIKDNKNDLENEPIIKKYEKLENNNNYYLINLEELNKTKLEYKFLLLKYINNKYDKKYENFNILFDKFDIRKSKGIKKIIDDYNYEFIKLIIISIIVITIICHIFYTDLLRW